jgi:hypothetical protein
MDLKEILNDGMNWNHLVRRRGHWRDLVKTVMNLRVLLRAVNFLVSSPP